MKVEDLYVPLLILLVMSYAFQSTIFKPIVINEYNKCYTCLKGNEQYPCDCSIVQQKENTVGWWYVAIQITLGTMVFWLAIRGLVKWNDQRLKEKYR